MLLALYKDLASSFSSHWDPILLIAYNKSKLQSHLSNEAEKVFNKLQCKNIEKKTRAHAGEKNRRTAWERDDDI